MKRILLFLVPSLLFFSFSYAQEICDDGIDNDGDGFIDCFDGDCSSDSACDGFYMGNDASCEAEPTIFPQFSLSLGYQSADNAATNLSRIVIGDLDRDGIPEILSTNQYNDKIYLLNGDDASVKHTTITNNPTFRSGSMANLEDDNCGEAFIINENSGNNYGISAFDCELNLLWTSERLYDDPVVLSFADFDRDGQAEMYYKDEIRDPLTGTRLVENSGINWDEIPSGGVAVDILGDEDLELVLGNKIYAVDLGNRTQNSGNLTLLATMPTAYQTKNGSYASAQSSSTSIADYNLDGNLDVIVTGADAGNVTSIFLWDVANSSVKKFNDPGGTGDYQFGWRTGMGRANIADINGDGQLNTTFVSGKYLYALDENWDLFWRLEVFEETSGITGATLFDFNGDGQSEIVYRDEDFLYIINGNDGSVNTQIHCRSRTGMEYPIVADVDADGSTEICVTCASENHLPGTPGRNLALTTPAEVRIYKSAGEPWVPSRRVWNQHGYFNVNINDDLTVPRNQQKHQAVFSDGVCSSGPNRPLNNFLNQSPLLSSDGCYTYAAPELNLIESSLTVNASSCLTQDFTVSFDFENIGDVALSGNIPVTFYDGDPLVAATNKLNTEFISLSKLEVGETFSAEDITINGTNENFILYAVLNDNGSTTPTPITLPNSNFLECDYTNNIVSSTVNLFPFQLSTEVNNNVTCSVGGTPNHGSIRAFYLLNGTEVTTDFDFYWFNGTTVDDTPDYTGSNYTSLSAGTYTVFATDKIAGCSSDTVQVVVEDSERILVADITVDRGNENCQNPNGQLSVEVNEGEPVGNFEYEWYEGNTVGGGLQISNSQVATGLTSATYTVLVTEKATGCQTILSTQVPDDTEIPNVAATATDIACSDTDNGIVSASVDSETTGYTFEWYIGTSEKVNADYTTSTVNNLPLGSYTVKATDDVTGCESALVTVVIEQSLPPEIEAISSIENNSCDPSQPNGTVTVSIVGEASDHTIEWFAGASTTGTAIGDMLSLSDLGAGEYTVKVTSDDTGCFITDRVTVINNIVQPNLTATTDPVTICSPFNGRIEASADLDAESDYTFSWYRGSEVKATADFSETGNILAELEAGFYTVQAFHNTRNCLTEAVTIEVVNEATFSANILTTVNEDYGSVANGSIRIGVDKADRAYEVLLNEQSYEIFNAGLSELEIENLSAGVYQIEVVDTASACSVNLTTEILINANTATDIISFELPTATSPAIIDSTNHTVEIEVDGLTDLTSLVADLEISEGATISPNADEAMDFTETVFYTVTAQDGVTTQEWEVTVIKAPIQKEDQTITFNLPDTLNQDQSPYPLEASSSSGLPIRFSVASGSASILNNKLVLTRQSEVVIKAYQAGNDTLNYAEVEKSVTVIGAFDISVNVLRSDDNALEEGLAKLFNENGGLFQRKKFTDGDLAFKNVRSGNYILQVIPLGSASSDVFPTYYASTHFNKEASVLRVSNDLSLNMIMKAKPGASADKGTGQINGSVVKSEESSNARISLGESNDGEGISEIIIYLLNESNGDVVRAAVTDDSGKFNMLEIPDGNYKLLLDIPGLNQPSTSFDLSYEAKNSEINLTIYINSEGIVDVEMSTVLGNDKPDYSFNIYPNPTNGILYINGYAGPEQEISIISSNGSIVKTVKLLSISSQEIDLTDLQEGVYYMKYEGGEQRMIKIIKN